MARRSPKSKTSVSIDLSDVESRVKAPDGDYRLKVDGVPEIEEGTAGDYIKWKFSVVGGKYEGAVVYYNTSLAKQALWNLRNLLDALEVEIPDSAFDLDLDDMDGLEMMGTIENETWQKDKNSEKKKQMRLTSFWVAEDEKSDKKDDDEKPSKKGRDKDDDKKSSKKSSKKEKVEQSDVDDMDEDELADLVKEHDLDVDLDDFASLRKKRAAVVDALEKEDLLAE